MYSMRAGGVKNEENVQKKWSYDFFLPFSHSKMENLGGEFIHLRTHQIITEFENLIYFVGTFREFLERWW